MTSRDCRRRVCRDCHDCHGRQNRHPIPCEQADTMTSCRGGRCIAGDVASITRSAAAQPPWNREDSVSACAGGRAEDRKASRDPQRPASDTTGAAQRRSQPRAHLRLLSQRAATRRDVRHLGGGGSISSRRIFGCSQRVGTGRPSTTSLRNGFQYSRMGSPTWTIFGMLHFRSNTRARMILKTCQQGIIDKRWH